MRLQQSKRVKAVAAFVMFAVAQISVQLGFAEPSPNAVLPVPQQYIARLRTSGNRPITVNNNAAATGASLVTGAMIETGADQSATIDIGDFTLDIAPNTRLRLDYDDQGRVKVFLIAGCVIARSKGKTAGRASNRRQRHAGPNCSEAWRRRGPLFYQRPGDS